MNGQPEPLNVCTIVSVNYLAFARVLARSFHEHNSEGRFFVLLADRNDGRIRLEQEPFELVEVENLKTVPDLLSLLFRYEQLECTTALKPHLLQYLFQLGLSNVVYLDPDILIMDSLRHLQESLARHPVILTPHLNAPLNDHAWPDEQAILQAGVYNLGFIALRRDEQAERLLEWWSDRLRDRCIVRPDHGLFVDQRWIDLAPGMWPGVHVETHPGYNVAYWNLLTRPVQVDASGRATTLGQPLLFFHFSGIDVDRLEAVSRHQNRFRLSAIGDAAGLYERYRKLLLDAGFLAARDEPYAFGRFDNDVPVPPCARRLYRDLGPAGRRFGNPFRCGPGSYYEWLNGRSNRGGLTRLTRYLVRATPELSRAFPDPDKGDRRRFWEWLELVGARAYGLAGPFVEPLRPEDSHRPGMRSRVRSWLRAVYHSAPSRSIRQRLKRRLGPARAARWAERLRPARVNVPADGPPPTGRFRLLPPPRLALAGINVFGYLEAPTGMGEAARGMVRALERAGYPVAQHKLDPEAPCVPETARSAGTEFDVNLFVVNADQVGALRDHLGGRPFSGRYNIGYWAWEQERFPSAWEPSFDWLHEVWTLSRFCQDAISAVAPVPVCRVPIPLEMRPSAPPNRERFGLAADRFVYLFVFNYFSYYERKNPVACVRAFRRAFAEEVPVRLVLKTAGAEFAPRQVEELLGEIGDDERIRVIEGTLDSRAMQELMGAADAYVSLHRSEGFGLTVAEAMALGKPVVATGYSGVTDFFGSHNGYPVGYRLVELERDEGPYRAGTSWAEPDLEHAAAQLRTVYEDRARSAQLGRRGQEEVRRQLSVDSVAAIVDRRLRALARRFGGAPVA